MNDCCHSCCPFWNQRQYPIFDYDQVDDLEFEDLVQNTAPQPQRRPLCDKISRLFNYHPSLNNQRGYQPITDVLDDQRGVEAAKLLSWEQVHSITKPYVKYGGTDQMQIGSPSTPLGSIAPANSMKSKSDAAAIPQENPQGSNQVFSPDLQHERDNTE